MQFQLFLTNNLILYIYNFYNYLILIFSLNHLNFCYDSFIINSIQTTKEKTKNR